MEPGWARLGGRAAGGRGRGREAEGEGKKKERRKAYSTRYSQAVSHPSTNQARPCLASEIRRDRARSGWYGRRRLWLPLAAPRACSAPPSPSPSPSPCPSIVSPPPPGLCLPPACLPTCLPACLPACQHAQGTRCLRHPGVAEGRALSHPGTLQPRRRLAPGMARGWVGAPGAEARGVLRAPPPTAPPPRGPFLLSRPPGSKPPRSPGRHHRPSSPAQARGPSSATLPLPTQRHQDLIDRHRGPAHNTQTHRHTGKDRETQSGGTLRHTGRERRGGTKRLSLPPCVCVCVCL